MCFFVVFGINYTIISILRLKYKIILNLDASGNPITEQVQSIVVTDASGNPVTGKIIISMIQVQLFICIEMLEFRYYMNLWGVAVLELNSHPDHNKGPDHAPCAGPKTHLIDH